MISQRNADVSAVVDQAHRDPSRHTKKGTGRAGETALEVFCRDYGRVPEVELTVKTWSSNHLSIHDIRAQADAFVALVGRGFSVDEAASLEAAVFDGKILVVIQSADHAAAARSALG